MIYQGQRASWPNFCENEIATIEWSLDRPPGSAQSQIMGPLPPSFGFFSWRFKFPSSVEENYHHTCAASLCRPKDLMHR